MEKTHFNTSIEWLNKAHQHAKGYSGCRKVQVGSVIVEPHYNTAVAFGANQAIPDACKSGQCLRVEKYGEDSKNHRLPSDCRAIHSELDAIISAAENLSGCTIYVTRYPCEACARAIVSAGITTVVYGREQEISRETAQIFEHYDVTVIHRSDWTAEDKTY